MAKVSMTVRLEQELIDRVDVLAERVGMTRTDIVERSIIAGLKEGESTADRLENPLVRAILEATMILDPSITKESAAEVREAVKHIKAAAKKANKGGSDGQASVT